jgi:ribokinase
LAPRIAVIGSNMMDLVTYGARMPGRGETLAADSFAIGHGGKGANQAIAAARLGSEVVMVTKVGDDAFADQQIQNFRANGVSTAHVGRVAGVSSGVAPIFVDHAGENAILIVKGANDHLAPADVDAAAEALSTCRLILLQMEVPAETVYHAIAFGRARGIEVLLNPAPAAADLDVEKIRDADFLVSNETELAILSGMPVSGAAEVEAAARSLIAKGIKTVIVTMGSRGALLVTAEAVRSVAPVRVDPVDTTGAGDAFIGAFAHFYAGGDSVEAALGQAARYAALSITRRGTQASYLTAEAFRAAAAD